MSARGTCVAALLVGVIGARDAFAQGAAPVLSVRASERNACFDAIPPSAMRRVPVYLTARLVDSSASRVVLREAVDLLTQAVAQTARTMLGTTEGVLPAAEPTITWRGLETDLLVVARRDGGIAWQLAPPGLANELRLDDTSAQLVGRALDTLVAQGERVVFPEGFPADSVSWLLHLQPAFLDEKGEVTTPRMRVGIPVFTILTPPQRQVGAEHVRVRYPDDLRKEGFIGNVVMQFVVDTTGHPEPATIRDLLPAGQPLLGVRERWAYDRFVRAIRIALEQARYTPARIGGCVVRQIVQQRFTFALGDGDVKR